MLRALYTSATGMKAQELMIDNTANNLANVNTNGFKRSDQDSADHRQGYTDATEEFCSPGQSSLTNPAKFGRAMANKYNSGNDAESSHAPSSVGFH